MKLLRNTVQQFFNSEKMIFGTKTSKQIREQLDRVTEAEKNGGKYHGMSYEEGVKYALEWILGDSNDEPMPKEK